MIHGLKFWWIESGLVGRLLGVYRRCRSSCNERGWVVKGVRADYNAKAGEAVECTGAWM